METIPEAETGEDAGPRGTDSARETDPALEAHYRFVLWLVPALERFPRSRKFLLGDRMQTVARFVAPAEAKRLPRTPIRGRAGASPNGVPAAQGSGSGAGATI